MGWPSFFPPHNVEVPESTCWFKNRGGKEWASPVFPHPTIEKEHAVS